MSATQLRYSLTFIRKGYVCNTTSVFSNLYCYLFLSAGAKSKDLLNSVILVFFMIWLGPLRNPYTVCDIIHNNDVLRDNSPATIKMVQLI